MCCSRIRVTLNGVVKDKHGGLAGTYQKSRRLTNNRSYWYQTNGGKVFWYDNIKNIWKIGYGSDLGHGHGDIRSVQDSACPTSDNLFKYYDGVEFNLAPINSVSIQCV